MNDSFALAHGEALAHSEALAHGEAPAGRMSLPRRAARLLARIEARVLYVQDQGRRALEAYFFADEPAFDRRYHLDTFEALRLKAAAPGPLRLDLLEQFAPQWLGLLPDDPDLRAALAELLAGRADPSHGPLPRLEAALGLPPTPVTAAETGPSLDPLDQAAAALQWLTLPDGAELYAHGAHDDRLYILISGKVRVTPAEAAPDAPALVLGRGELLGLIEVLTGEPRAETIQAIRDCELVALPRQALLTLSEACPAVLLRLNRILAARLRAQLTAAACEPPPRLTVAVLPAGNDLDAPLLTEFTRRLAAELEAWGCGAIIDAPAVDEALGPESAQAPLTGADHAQLAAWLNTQEANERFLLLQADPEPSPWTARCVRQADVILAVGWAASSPALNVVEAILGEQPPTARLELVLLHPDGSRQPHGTRAWLELRQSQTHYHVRLDRQTDFARLARRLTGRGLGLVLGGGGARGFAHIGVYQALQEGGWEVDLLGGTSMGAILGAAFALDLTPAALYDLARQVASPLRLFDPTLPVVSFFASDKVTTILRQVFGAIQIEDLWRPFFCISSSLSRAAPVVHLRGSLWQAVRASMAIPGIFSPLLIDGDLLVDGAVLNNLPSDVMLEFSQGGPVIAVNVFPEVDLDKHYAFGPSVSGVEALWRKLNPLTEDLLAPSIFENLVRVVSLNDVQQARAKAPLVDLYLRPAVESWNILDFGAWEAISAVGYATAQAALRGELGPRLEAARLRRPTPLASLADTLDTLAQVLEARQTRAVVAGSGA